MKKNNANILIVDDNQEALIAMDMYLSKHFTRIQTEKNPNLIPHLVSTNNFDVVILDMNFSAGINTGNEGIYWLSEILKIDPYAAVVLITAYGDIELAVKGIKNGAHDFISKPWENEKLLATVNAAYNLHKSKLEIVNLKNRQQHLSANIANLFNMFKGSSSAMTPTYETIEKVANTDANILILGENGTGKELIARSIHTKSAKETFITVDVASLPESLIESELFGYTKGAFTDARENKPGRFELANNGTLYLDEIGNIPLALQTKLLTTLQTKEIMRLGSTKAIPINFRLISATNSSLYTMVENKQFREDLLYRINTIQIELPSLRQRVEDIKGFAHHFLGIYGKKYDKNNMKINPAAINKLEKYQWPGNIRELEHLTEKAVIMSDGATLRADDFQFNSSGKLKQSKKIVFSLEENEKIIIGDAMRECNGNLSQTADRLGITRATLYRKIKKYDL